MDVRLIGVPLDESSDEGTLADAGLTTYQDDLAPRRLDPSQQVGHQLEFLVPL
jgi:hypothetical protein